MLPWIDALRGLAILMVLANHVALVVPGLSAPLEMLARFGQMGVQLFFVASAYTLCLSWQQRRADDTQPVLRWLPAPLCAIGRRSYALYVVQVLFAWHALRPLVAALALRGDAAYALSLAAVVGLSCIAAALLTRWIERPGIAVGRRIVAALPSNGAVVVRGAVS